MPATLLPSYSASFSPNSALGTDFLNYCNEVRDRMGDVFKWAGVKTPLKIEVGAQTAFGNYAGTTRAGDLYVIGTLSRGRRAELKNKLWVPHYDVAACSFDEDFINSFRERMERPMQFVRSNGASEILVPVIIDCGLFVACDANLFEELQRELAAERPVIPVGRLGLAPA